MIMNLNKNALRLVDKAMEKKEEIRIRVETGPFGCTIIDAGIKAPGGYAAGKLVIEICLASYGTVSSLLMQYGDLVLPSIFVETDFPAIATLGSQFGGWNIKTGDYFAMGSGPARALARKPRSIYELIGYEEHSDLAVIVLEADSFPTEEAVKTIADECEISPRNLYVIVAPTSSAVGSIQVSGRIVETGIHKLLQVGLDPKLISHGCGYAPIPPIHPKTARAIGRTNDAIIYGGSAFYTAAVESDDQLKESVRNSSSCTSTVYGKPFYDILKAAEFDMYRIDPNLFAPAVISVNNVKTGTTFKAGKINVELLRRTMGFVDT